MPRPSVLRTNYQCRERNFAHKRHFLLTNVKQQLRLLLLDHFFRPTNHRIVFACCMLFVLSFPCSILPLCFIAFKPCALNRCHLKSCCISAALNHLLHCLFERTDPTFESINVLLSSLPDVRIQPIQLHQLIKICLNF